MDAELRAEIGRKIDRIEDLVADLRAENERLREALAGAYNAMGDAAQRKNDMARLFAEHIYKAEEALK